ncbi:MAG TPA: (2Fe-2S)-binding protein [Thermoprotei archaeon]|nr:(2Fe-2S)-binding protein [Thermoprotei archaeon]
MCEDKGKKFVCLCEEVTYEDVVKAIKEGYDDIESLKRHLKIGMGPCQGRICLPIVVRIMARVLGKKPEEIGYPSQRPPIYPIPFKVLAKGEKDDEG